MTNTPSVPPKGPIFKAGDQVRLISPTPDRGKQGTITEVLGRLGDIYRYQVHFEDGTVGKFFGFELELIKNSSSSIPPRRAS